jgi:uncharacterized protein YciW
VTTHSLLQRLLFATISAALLGVGFAQTPEPAPSTQSAGANSTAPFLALTHTEALTRAKAENKPLLLFFDGHWSERAREVRPKIFSAPAIAAINDHALALRIDVLTAPELTKQYRIFRVPTLLWINPTGSVKYEWVDCEDPSDIRDEIIETLTRLPKLRASTRPDDPVGRFKLARACYEAGEYAACLTEIRWLYLEAIRDNEESTPAKKKKDRISVFEVISLLQDIAPLHNPARETIPEFLQREEQKVRADPRNAAAALKFWRLAQILHEYAHIDALLASLPSGPARDALAKRESQKAKR